MQGVGDDGNGGERAHLLSKCPCFLHLEGVIFNGLSLQFGNQKGFLLIARSTYSGFVLRSNMVDLMLFPFFSRFLVVFQYF